MYKHDCLRPSPLLTLFTARMLAPCCSRKATAGPWLREAAKCRGVHPLMVAASRYLPRGCKRESSYYCKTPDMVPCLISCVVNPILGGNPHDRRHLAGSTYL